jgi:hypothetical protein
MDWGYFVLGGIFVGAALLMVFNHRHRRSVEQELIRRGLQPCEDEAPALQKAFTGLASGHGGVAPGRYTVSRCFKRATGRGMVYRFSVLDESHVDDGPDRNSVGAAYDAYLLRLPNGDQLTRGPVSLALCPSGPSAFRAVMAKLAAANPLGAPLAVPDDSRILAAWGETSRPLDELVPRAMQERLVRSADVGVLSAHFQGGQAAFTVNPQRRWVEPQLNWIVEWM